jgi:hypothetical protein
MDPGILQVADKFRALWGAKVSISPAPGAIGRKDGASFHNYVKHGTVKALDLFPEGMKNADDFARAYECALKAGATGFGVYPDWLPQPGIHIDVGVREGRGVGNPATWSGIRRNGKQIYVALSEVL